MLNILKLLNVKKTIILLFIGLYTFMLNAQDDKKPRVEFSGFLKYDLWYDTRKNVEAIDGLVLLYPKNEDLFDGKDMNDKASVNALTISSRVRSIINGPVILRAQTSAKIEVDFTGRSNTAGVRLREAYIKMKWTETELIMGQTWHPMFVTDVFPSVHSMNTGVPFQCFNRSTQISLKQTFGVLDVLGAAIFQNDYTNLGPNMGSSEYMKDAIVPNFHIQSKITSGGVIVGAAFDYKILQPTRIVAVPLIYENENYKAFATEQTIGTWATMAYFRLKKNSFTLKAKGMYGQNLTEQLLPGGYAVKSINFTTQSIEYTPTNHYFVWINPTYGETWQFGIFVGYCKNLGLSDNAFKEPYYFYARAADADNILRLAPQITYKNGPLSFGFEVEYTEISYGKIDYTDKCKVIETKKFKNNRFLFVALYNF